MSNLSHEPHSNADLKSEVERLKVELEKVNGFREALRSKFHLKSDQLSEALCHIEAMKRHHDEAQAAAAVMREAMKTPIEFLRFLRNNTSEKFANQLEASLSTTAGTAFLARMAEAARIREALNNLLIHAVEFSRDWRKGDFDLCPLAQCDMRSLESQFEESQKALDAANFGSPVAHYDGGCGIHRQQPIYDRNTNSLHPLP